MTTKTPHVFYIQFLQRLSLLFSRHTVFVVTLPRRKHRVLSSSPYLPLPRDILSFRMISFYKAPGTSSQEHTVFTTYSDGLLCHNTSVSQTPVFYMYFTPFFTKHSFCQHLGTSTGTGLGVYAVYFKIH